MNILSPKRYFPIALATAFALTIWLVLGTISWAATPFNPDPLFEKAELFSLEIKGDPADLYLPVSSSVTSEGESLPLALLLQGINVDKSNYGLFAETIARYGFAVVVPNHLRTFTAVPGLAKMALFPDQHQIIDVLAFMKQANFDPSSPVFGRLDTSKLVLLGHSMGGVAGLKGIENTCIPPFCLTSFARPLELVAGVFYGTHLQRHAGEKITPIDNEGIKIALIQGSLDSQATLTEVQATFDQIQQPPKTLITILGANHYGITNLDNPANPAGIPAITPDPTPPTLAQATAIETIARWSALFLRGQVLGDEGALDYVERKGDARDENASVVSQMDR